LFVCVAPPYKRSARDGASSVTSPLSALPLSGLGMGLSGSPTPTSSTPFLPNLPISSLRSNLPSELYVSALANSSGISPLIPGGSKLSPGALTGAATISPTGKSGLLPSVPLQTLAPTTGRAGRSHGSGGPRQFHQGGRNKHLPTWMDAPDDLFFHSTQVTK